MSAPLKKPCLGFSGPNCQNEYIACCASNCPKTEDVNNSKLLCIDECVAYADFHCYPQLHTISNLDYCCKIKNNGYNNDNYDNCIQSTSCNFSGQDIYNESVLCTTSLPTPAAKW